MEYFNSVCDKKKTAVIALLWLFLYFLIFTRPRPTVGKEDMFTIVPKQISNTVVKYTAYATHAHGEQPTSITYSRALHLLKTESKFRDAVNQALVQSTFKSFFWELPPITPQSIHQGFEFVLVSAPSLSTNSPQPYVFTQIAQGAGTPSVRAFPNLGGDAVLIVPTQAANTSIRTYTHLANFVRDAPAEQIHTLWSCVGTVALSFADVQNEDGDGDCLMEGETKGVDRKSEKDTRVRWISTSGLGVYWLHIRLDTVPKYYTYLPYKHYNH